MTVIILSGGKSTRMGQNKSLLKIGNRTAIERIVDLVRPIFPYIILSTNTPSEYEFLGLEMVPDIYSNAGPIAGIHAGLKASTTDKNFIISCDMQLMNAKTIKFLVEFETESSITIAKADGFYQQLAGVYHKSVIAKIENIIVEYSQDEIRDGEQVKRGCKVFSLIKEENAMIIDAEKDIPNYEAGTFFNMNKPSEFEEISRLLNL
ncbi:MAG: molybdenum cofactor guanylyltransferase [Candidatus Kapaibacterium sp.]